MSSTSIAALERLLAADPASFKEVMAEVANKLMVAACQASGEKARTLARRAADFEKWARTGQLPSPP